MLAPSKHTDAVAVEHAGMCELPDGWALATISELIGRGGIFIDGDWVESKDQDPSGDVRLIQLADVGDSVYLDKSSRFLTAKKSRELKCTYLVAGDVLIARMPDPLGRACIYPGDPKTSVTAVDVCIVRTGVSGPDHHWLAWFVNSPEFRDNVALLQSGSTRKRISRKNLATIALPVPPLTEQHRIVAEIEKQFTRLDASVAALKRVQANLKRYRASVLKAACEGKLVPTEAELAQIRGPRLRARRPAPGAHPVRAPRPLGVPGEAPGQVQRACRAGHVRPAGATGGLGVGDGGAITRQKRIRNGQLSPTTNPTGSEVLQNS